MVGGQVGARRVEERGDIFGLLLREAYAMDIGRRINVPVWAL
jgi:hypothetical protein